MDLRIALRSLGNHRAFSIAAVVMIAAGSSFCIAAISFALTIAYPPPVFPNQAEVVEIWNGVNPTRPADYLTAARALEWRATPLRSITSLALVSPASMIVGSNLNRQVAGAIVTGEFFGLIGLRVARGRLIDAGDDRAGAERTVVLGHALWLREFGGDAGVIGTTVRINGESRIVIGIAPRNFRYPMDAELWLPLATVSQQHRPPIYLQLATLKPGATLESVRAEAIARAATELKVDSARYGNQGVAVIWSGENSRNLTGTRLALGITAGLAIFLAALANLAVLVLLRAARAAHTSAIRLALGASRFHLIRPLLLESGLIAVAGVAGGIILALWGAGFARLVLGITAPHLAFTIDVRVAMLAGIVVLTVTTVLGTVPALLWRRVAAADLLRGGNFAVGRRGTTHARNLLILTEVTLALTLAGGAILLLHSYRQFMAVDLGYDAAAITRISPIFKGSAYEDPRLSTELVQNVLANVERDRSIAVAAAWRELAVSWGQNPIEQVSVSGRSEPFDRRAVFTRVLEITPAFFDVFELIAVQGRLFDGSNAGHSVVINADAAALFFPGLDPIGQRIRIGTGAADEWRYVVGVVRNTAPLNFLGRTLQVLPGRINPLIFRVAGEHTAIPTNWAVLWNGYSFAARATTPGALAIRPITAELGRQAPDLPIEYAGSMEQFLNGYARNDDRSEAQVLGVFAGFALLLALFGIYAVVADGVRERHRELAVRISLGASPVDVIRLVAAPALASVAIGCAIAVVTILVAHDAGRDLLSMNAQLQAIRLPPLPLGAACVAIMLVALAAALVGARGVAHVHPVDALRDG